MGGVDIMRKVLLSAAAVLTLMLTMVPVTARASEVPDLGGNITGSHDKSHEGWTELNLEFLENLQEEADNELQDDPQDESQSESSGDKGYLLTGEEVNLYLSEKLELTENLIIGDGETETVVNLCLNGKRLEIRDPDMENAEIYTESTDEETATIIIRKNAVLNILDCSEGLDGQPIGKLIANGTEYTGGDSLTETVEKIDLSNATVSGNTVTYDGTEKKITLLLDGEVIDEKETSEKSAGDESKEESIKTAGEESEEEASIKTTDKSSAKDSDNKDIINYEIVYTLDGIKVTPINAGTYQYNVEGTGKYKGTLSGELVIKPAELEIENATAEDRKYDTTDTVIISEVKLNGIAEQNDVKDDVKIDITNLTGKIADVNTGEYVEVILPESQLNLIGDDADNYILKEIDNPVVLSKCLTITQADAQNLTGDLTIKNNFKGSFTYDLSDLKPDMTDAEWGNDPELKLELESVDLKEGYYDITKGEAEIADSKLTLPVQPVKSSKEEKIGIVTIKITSRNFEESQLTITVKSSNKESVNISGIKVSDKTYDGKAVSYSGTPIAKLVAGNQKVIVSGYTYTWLDQDGNELAENKAPSKVGKYQLLVEVTETDQDYTGSCLIDFEIKEKAASSGSGSSNSGSSSNSSSTSSSSSSSNSGSTSSGSGSSNSGSTSSSSNSSNSGITTNASSSTTETLAPTISNFWKIVYNQLGEIEDGKTLTVDAGSYTWMPKNVMEILGTRKNVTLIIKWNGGSTITIKSNNTVVPEATRVYYTLAELEKCYVTNVAGSSTAGTTASGSVSGTTAGTTTNSSASSSTSGTTGSNSGTSSSGTGSSSTASNSLSSTTGTGADETSSTEEDASTSETNIPETESESETESEIADSESDTTPETETDDTEKTDRKNQLALIIVIAVLLILLVALIIFIINRRRSFDEFDDEDFDEEDPIDEDEK